MPLHHSTGRDWMLKKMEPYRDPTVDREQPESMREA
jgi:hypothetical protein